MYIRKKRMGGRVYHQVVEGYRDAEGRVRHRTVISLGKCATIKQALDADKRADRRDAKTLEWLKQFWPDPEVAPKRHRAQIAAIEHRLTQRDERRRTLQQLAKSGIG